MVRERSVRLGHFGAWNEGGHHHILALPCISVPGVCSFLRCALLLEPILAKKQSGNESAQRLTLDLSAHDDVLLQGSSS